MAGLISLHDHRRGRMPNAFRCVCALCLIIPLFTLPVSGEEKLPPPGNDSTEAGIRLAGNEPETPNLPKGHVPVEIFRWEIPQQLHRMYLLLGTGCPYFIDRLAAFSNYPHESEDLTYSDVFGNGSLRTIMEILEVGVHITPIITVNLGLNICNSFSNGTDVPEINFYELQKLRYIGKIGIFQIVLGFRLSLPFLLESGEFLKTGKAEMGEGFAPYIRFAGGLSVFSTLEIGIIDGEHFNEFLEERTLFSDSISLSFISALGLEYRFSFMFIYLEGGFSYLGRPRRNWPSYSSAESIMCFFLGLGVGVYVF